MQSLRTWFISLMNVLGALVRQKVPLTTHIVQIWSFWWVYYARWIGTDKIEYPALIANL